jgi:hypothetical protein
MTRTFTPTEARRETVPLLIALVAPSGGGKTFSALRLAKGIQSVRGGDIHLIDTENRRGLHYAEEFSFKHVQFDPPFGSLDYVAALEQSAKAGAGVIVVDSMSHEHESVGGLIDLHESELDRMAGDNFSKRQAMTMLAWQKPKQARRKLLQAITRLDAHVILCFRAKESSRPVKTNGKVQIVPMGFMPIAGDEFVYECALSALLLPGSKGVPAWHPENPGERMAVKRPGQFEKIVPDGAQLSEQIGAALAKWAQGPGCGAPGASKAENQGGAPTGQPATDPYAAVAKYKSELLNWFPTAASREEIDARIKANKAAFDRMKEKYPDVYAEIMEAAETAMRDLPETAPAQDELEMHLEGAAS